MPRKFVYVVQSITTRIIYGIFPTDYQAESYVGTSGDFHVLKLRLPKKLSKKELGID